MKLILVTLAPIAIFLMAGCSVHRDVSHRGKHWKHLERKQVYRLVRSVQADLDPQFLRGRWDFRLVGFKHAHGITIPAGTLIRIDKVYQDSEPLQYLSIEYGGTILTGRYEGKQVDVTLLLDGAGYSYWPNAKYLERVSGNDLPSQAGRR